MKHLWVVILISVLLMACALCSFFLGRYPAGLSDGIGLVSWMVQSKNPSMDPDMRLLENIFFNIRMPRILGAILVGSALSVSGAAFQSMFINPLVSPGLLGVLAGASFGAAMAMVFFKSFFAVQVSAFVFGCMAVFLSMGLARLFKGDRLLMLILGGIVSGSFFTALLSMVKYLADPYDQLPAIVFWLMGGLSSVTNQTLGYVCVPILTSMGILMALTPYMNALSMGEEEARSLGVHVGLIRFILIACATLMSALTIIMAGIIGWVGLVVPHMARMIVGPDNRVLIPSAALIGGLYLLAMDDLSRLVFTVEIPLGILTALCGIPFFVLVLRHARKGWG
ncbi:MAG: iron ABC transporter permease [Proteobacteria bacterium]|nr:iron ABC transporter permease [Pseudomonadota bacterium]